MKTITERLTAAQQGPHLHNSWPNLPLVSAVETHDPRTIWEWARSVPERGAWNQPLVKWMPPELAPHMSANVRRAMEGGGQSYGTAGSVYWAFERPGGQEVLGEPNLVALFPPEQVWGDRTGRGLVVVTVGCTHELSTRTLSNCYSETKCSKCSYGYRTDSGD